jgi:hypothetical protein
MNQKQRRWFWIFLTAGVVIVVMGWIVTIRQVASSSFPVIRSQVDKGLEKASSGLQDAESSVEEKQSVFSEALEEAQKGYQQEKERQQQEEQTISPDSDLQELEKENLQ